MKSVKRKKVRYRRHCLENDLLLLLSENHRLPLVSISAFVLAGLDQNPPDRPGIAALTSRLLDEGTQNYEAHEIAEIIEGSGGCLTTFSERELSGISLFTRSEDLHTALELLREMLVCPIFPEDRFELENEKVLSRLQAMDDDPQVVAANRFNRWIYQGSPLQYSILGTQESVHQLQVSELKEFHLQKYAPQNTILVIVGAIDGDDALAHVAEQFSDWRNPGFYRREISGFRRQTEPSLDEYFMDKEQITIFLGHLGVTRDNPDYHTLQVMDVILGSGPGFTSRIPRKLRDEQGLAYSTYSDISGSSGIYPGCFVAFVSTSPENQQKALDGLLFEIENLVENGVTCEELAAAQDFLTGNFVFEFQSNVSVARFLLATELFELGEDYPEQYPQIIRAIDCDDVSRVARRYLDTLNYTTVVVGPIHDDKPHNRSKLPPPPSGQTRDTSSN
ncbi:insulinase family protein [Acidobacteria bacterium AH-259-L09]|nr:insulinase family protein [Acidobacteria bacterium AH-259-L09]